MLRGLTIDAIVTHLIGENPDRSSLSLILVIANNFIEYFLERVRMSTRISGRAKLKSCLLSLRTHLEELIWPSFEGTSMTTAPSRHEQITSARFKDVNGLPEDGRILYSAG